jgi:glutamate synthase (NADPH/NADH) small chain
VYFALEFLIPQNKEVSGGRKNPINVAGKHVVVIGGGDTGTDCVGTSLRHGCSSVTQLEILPMPPASRAKDNPWPEWPKVYRMDYGQEEAAAIQGQDPRQYEVTAKRFIAGADGKLEGVEITNIRWEKDVQGRFVPRDVEGTLRIIPAGLVLLAMGFLGPEDQLLNALKIERDPRSNAKAEHENFSTNLEGVFAAGDCRRGQSLVVWAINEGRGAAREVDRYLMGNHESLDFL